MDNRDSFEQISNYYSGIDEQTLDNLSKKNNNILNLIKLSTITNVRVLNKHNKSWKLKDKTRIINDCNKIKNQELKSSGSLLSKLAKSNHDYKIKDNVRIIYNELENKLDNINKIINYINDINDIDIDNKVNKIKTKQKIVKNKINIINTDTYNSTDSYIECFSNY